VLLRDRFGSVDLAQKVATMKPTTKRLMKRQGEAEILFGRTDIGQTLYDVISSSMTAAEVVRRHPKVSRDFVLYMRRKFNRLRRLKK
jgi:hypothetical protein